MSGRRDGQPQPAPRAPTHLVLRQEADVDEVPVIGHQRHHLEGQVGLLPCPMLQQERESEGTEPTTPPRLLFTPCRPS